jgi:hypothetical protein
MRSGEWLRTQWIGRVALDLGVRAWDPLYGRRVMPILDRLHSEGKVERRRCRRRRAGTIEGVPVAFDISRSEWRITRSGRRVLLLGRAELFDGGRDREPTFDDFVRTWLEVRQLPERASGTADR